MAQWMRHSSLLGFVKQYNAQTVSLTTKQKPYRCMKAYPQTNLDRMFYLCYLMQQSAKHAAYILNNFTRNPKFSILYIAIGICHVSIPPQLLMHIITLYCFCDAAVQVPPEIIPKGVKYLSGNETSLIENLYLGQQRSFQPCALASSPENIFQFCHPNRAFLCAVLYIVVSIMFLTFANYITLHIL